MSNNITNPRSAKSRDAFTLIELLVVIAIIIILAGLSFAVSGGVMRSSRKAEVRSMAHQIKSAISGYYAEYGVYPTNTKTDEAFYRMITGVATNQNRRGIRFLEVPPKFLNAEPGTNTPIMTPARYLPLTNTAGGENGRALFTIVTDAMDQGGFSKPYDGTIYLPNKRTINGSVAVYAPDPDKTGDDAWVGTW
jgi:prepilin-type N-terminal cleavage/methylation domain-containing protein